MYFLTYLLFLVPPMLLGLWAQRRVSSTFAEWSRQPSSSRLTGADVARRILDHNGLTSVPVRRVPGELSDHYDPKSRTVNLSEPVYGSNSVAAVSVAAHEVGHAIQHAKAYAPMTARSAMWPAVAFTSTAWQPILLVGMVMTWFTGATSGTPLGVYIMLGAVVLYTVVVLFQIVTLPVELDASRRAKAQMLDMGFVGPDAEGASKVLNAAAMTYVAGALAALSTLAYYLFMIFGSRR